VETPMNKPAILFVSPDGLEVWALPREVVAHNRAKYYAEKDPDTTYQGEFDYVCGDHAEAVDWFRNNMNPEDVIHHFVQIKKEEKDLADRIGEFDTESGVAEFPNQTGLE
jgi:hypothetical protein